MKPRFSCVLMIVAIVIGSGTPTAWAAYLEKIDENVTKSASPAGLAPEQSCGDAHASIVFNPTVNPNGHSAEFAALNTSDVSVQSTPCSETAATSLGAQYIFDIQPEPGETVGELVTVCYRAAFTQTVTATTGFTSSSTLRNDADLNGTITFSFGPQTLTDNGQFRRTFQRQFMAAIGDTLSFALAQSTSAHGADVVGSASAVAQTNASFSLGACATQGTPVPAAGLPGTLGVIAALTILAGISLRRRGLKA